MEQKKELTWEERHPNGDVRNYTFFDEFESLPTLDKIETKVALRVLKCHLEEKLGFEMTDELFVAIIKRIPYLAPTHPYGMFLKAHHAVDEHWMKTVSIIMEFFKIGGGGYTISERF